MLVVDSKLVVESDDVVDDERLLLVVTKTEPTVLLVVALIEDVPPVVVAFVSDTVLDVIDVLPRLVDEESLVLVTITRNVGAGIYLC